MKSLALSFVFLLLTAIPVYAAATPSATPQVKGLYDEELEYSDTYTATPSPTPSPTASTSASTRTTRYLDTSSTPVSGTVENTIIILGLGIVFIAFGIKFTKN